MVYRILYALCHSGLRLHYGQTGEDILIRPYLKDKAQYLDLGAYHPFRFSNTARLWAEGWNGVNVDANIDSINIFKKKRPKDISIHAALITKKQRDEGLSEISFYKSVRDVKKHKCGISAHGSLLISEIEQIEVKVPTKTVDEILDQCDLVNTQYLNIDIEGMDELILRDLNFDRFQPKVITIEDHQESVAEALNSGIATFLNINGYNLIARSSMTSVFILS